MRTGLVKAVLILKALVVFIPQAVIAAGSLEQPIVEFYGTCDASGAVRVSDGLFMVADDEDNIMRIYDAEKGGYPVGYFDLTTELIPRLHPGGSLAGRGIDVTRELDLEAGTRVGDVSYWITSHSVSKKGAHRAERFQFLALSHESPKGRVQVRGEPSVEIMNALIQHPELATYVMENETHCASDQVQTVNIEGMTARMEGGVFIGFRNPVPEGKALIIGLDNPESVVEGGIPALGELVRLDLQGLGVRGMLLRRDRYIIAAGDQGLGPERALYSWKGEGSAPEKLAIDLPKDFNPEAFFSPSSGNRFMVLSDDGGRSAQGNSQCKKLKDFTQKSFRGVWISESI